MNQQKAEIVPKKDTRLVLFQGEGVRQKFHNGQWFFSIVDIVEVLVGSGRHRKYWSDLKTKLTDTEGVTQLSAQIGQLKLTSADGKLCETDVANMTTVLRIIQSIPSKSAEPFKKWLAEVGDERLKEVNDSEIAFQRAIYTYKAAGHDDKWIKKRVQTVRNRRGLTSEWQQRGLRMVFNTHY